MKYIVYLTVNAEINIIKIIYLNIIVNDIVY